MKLRNVNPASLVDRTIIYRGQFWEVADVTDDHVLLKKSWANQTGRLRVDQLAECSLYPSRDEVERRYPFLIRAVRQACILTTSEAIGAVHGYLTTGPFFMGSEAVAHVGGARRAVEHALRCRHFVRQLFLQPA